jgi:hypothetical protein
MRPGIFERHPAYREQVSACGSRQSLRSKHIGAWHLQRFRQFLFRTIPLMTQTYFVKTNQNNARNDNTMKTKPIIHKPHWLGTAIFLFLLASVARPLSAQTSSGAIQSIPALTHEEKEAMYNATVEDRTEKIMEALAMTDSASSNRVHDSIASHYHALRARDQAIDDELSNMSKGSDEWRAKRVAMFPSMSQPLHEQFIARISKDLTSEQLETIKDKMTYGKVQFTYNGYCSILPNLSDAEKAKIMDLLKQAREVAMDGGSAGEKTAIFQQYKDQINSYLQTQGIDVAKATQEWLDRQKLAEKKSGDDGSAPAK